ncbi:hypothetical protein PR202_ga02154 [Eleusine coracana subsp. coracana]|uniref:Uncharacterized protein n=1 Tax=Eleusine coracana subsp. coracana TaxID=191504 RepID=A0AAV5BK01_ELECO|nr:hypothetical protein PR202_ga02154 [Eleusine coracana subsp. coracana]
MNTANSVSVCRKRQPVYLLNATTHKLCGTWWHKQINYQHMLRWSQQAKAQSLGFRR